MRHRGSSKIKYEHHIIQGLRQLLERIEPWDEIDGITPGAIKRTKSHQRLASQVQYNTSTGVKCPARSGPAVQEVFIVTPKPEEFKGHLKEIGYG
jgi:hypothetical protein